MKEQFFLSETREYEVIYDEDDIYCFSLLDDIKNGDLVVLSYVNYYITI